MIEEDEIPEEFILPAEDLIAILKAEGLYLRVSKSGELQIHPTNGDAREEALELATLNRETLIAWLKTNPFFDA